MVSRCQEDGGRFAARRRAFDSESGGGWEVGSQEQGGRFGLRKRMGGLQCTREH